jgi:GNAT superfamily N-acetyltransferase
MSDPAAGTFEITVMPTNEISQTVRSKTLTLFHQSYRDADGGYLEQSFAKLRYLAIATTEDATLAGFALGDMRIVDLPRLPAHPLALAGICCVDPRFRRHGLFRELERRAFLAAGVGWRPRVLSCGRMAHPASFRTMLDNPTRVPKPGVSLTPWQKEIGAAVAKIYGVSEFDADTFVCRGRGTPMSCIIDVDVTPEEWKVFAPVDRTRGDSLLGMIWVPDAPEGW